MKNIGGENVLSPQLKLSIAMKGKPWSKKRRLAQKERKINV